VRGAVEEIEDGRVLDEEPVQALRYKPGQRFTMHTDNGESHPRRAWTCVVEMQSAPGARLEIEDWPDVVLEPGDLVVFPSGYRHQATPPTEGKRYSVVMWFSDPPGVPAETPSSAQAPAGLMSEYQGVRPTDHAVTREEPIPGIEDETQEDALETGGMA